MKKSEKIEENITNNSPHPGGGVNLKKLLSEYFIKINKLPERANVPILYKNAFDFMCLERMDLIIKYLYVKSLDKGYKTDFFLNLYKEHLRAFNNFNESGNDYKNSFEAFLKVFNDLYYEIKDAGMDENISCVPIISDNLILDGAHRTSISAYFRKQFPCIQFSGNGAVYPPLFFIQRGLSQEFTEYAVMEHLNLIGEKDIHIALFWPRAAVDRNKLQQGFNLLAKRVSVMYFAEYKATYEMTKNLAVLLYKGEDWLGNEDNNFIGADAKAECCYYPNKSVLVVVFKHNDIEEIVRIKEEIRNIFQIENSGLHTTDTTKEAARIARAIFSKNGRYFLSYGKPYFIRGVLQNLRKMQKMLRSLGVPDEDYVFDTSSVMALFGIRAARDVDFLIREKHLTKMEENHIETHNELLTFYEKSLDELIMNPENYFYVDDMKCLSLENILRLKYNRYDKPKQDAIKDICDIKLIESFLMNHQ